MNNDNIKYIDQYLHDTFCDTLVSSALTLGYDPDKLKKYTKDYEKVEKRSSILYSNRHKHLIYDANIFIDINFLLQNNISVDSNLLSGITKLFNNFLQTDQQIFNSSYPYIMKNLALEFKRDEENLSQEEKEKFIINLAIKILTDNPNLKKIELAKEIIKHAKKNKLKQVITQSGKYYSISSIEKMISFNILKKQLFCK